MATKINPFHTLKLGPRSKESGNFSQHCLGIGDTMIVEWHLARKFWGEGPAYERGWAGRGRERLSASLGRIDLPRSPNLAK